MAEKTLHRQAPAPRRAAPAAAAPRRAAATEHSPPPALGNHALQQALAASVGRGRVALSRPGDADENEADRLAAGFVAGRGAAAPARAATPAGPASGIGRGSALPDAVRRDAERYFGAALGGVRVHTDVGAAHSATALGARAYALRDDIHFGAGQFDPVSRAGRRLLAHELAHVLQARARPADAARLRRDPDPQADQSGGFVTPAQLQNPPQPLSTIVPVQLDIPVPALADPAAPRRRKDAELLSFQMPVRPLQQYLFFAVPATHVFGSAAEARASGLRPPARAATQPVAGAGGTTSTAVTTPPTVAPVVVPATAPAAPVGSMVYTPDGQSHLVVGATADAVVLDHYTRFAVGAGSTSLLDAGGRFIVIDAGTFGPAGNAVAQATLRALEARIGANGHIASVLITHAHADHMSLLPELARRFRIGAIRINALQADRPDFQALLDQVRQIHHERVQAEANRVRSQLASERPAWEAADRGDPLNRGQRWNELRDARVRTALEAIPDIQLERLVPGLGGRLAVAAVPLSPTALYAQAATVPGDTLAPGVRAPAVTDPAFADELRERGNRGPLPADIDRFSSSWVVDVRGRARFLVLPDIRGTEFQNLLHDFRRAVQGLGMEANFQVWDVSHHMQIGWSGGGTATAGAPSVRASQLGHISRFLHTFRAGTRQAPGMDVVVVSAYEGFSSRGTSYVDPANVWVLKSLGFEVFLATSGRDVSVLQAVTSQGRSVSGVVGEARGGATPRTQLLRRAEAALAELRDTARLARAELRRARVADQRAAIQARLDQATTRIAAIDRLRLAYLDAVHDEIGRNIRGTAPGGTAVRPAVAPAPGAPEPAAAQAGALEQRLNAEGFDRPVPTTGSARFTEAALAVVAPGLLDANAPPGSPAAQALELARSRERIREIESRPADSVDSARNRAELLAEMHRYRAALEAQVREPATSGSSRQVLDDELRTARQRINELTPGPETRTLRQRLAGSGALVETQFVAPRRMASARTVAANTTGQPTLTPTPNAGPGLGERSGALIQAGAERGFGALMVYQTFRAEADVIDRARAGKAGAAEVAATTAHSALGTWVGLRLLRGNPVGNGVFVALSVLEVAQAASRDYASADQRNTEVAYATLRAGVNLALGVVGTVLMATVPPPIGVLLGLGVMFLGDSILNALGAHDWIEQMASFQPRQVTKVEQQMRKLVDEYQVIVGAIELAERDDASLRAVGAPNPALTRAVASSLADTHRIRAIPLEQELLSRFSDAYDRAQGAYAGLAELDEIRRRFYGLMQRAHPRNEEFSAYQRRRAALLAKYDLTEDDFDANGRIRSRRKRRVRQWVDDDERILLDPLRAPILDQARTTFEGIEAKLSLAQASASQIEDLEQWEPIDTKLNVINFAINEVMNSDSTVSDLIEKESEVRRMLDNARYRVEPPPGAYRGEPLLPSSAPGHSTYMRMLKEREQRLWWTRRRLSDLMSVRGGRLHRIDYDPDQSTAEREGQPSSADAERPLFVLRTAEEGLRDFEDMMATMPKAPQQTVRAIFTNSADTQSGYAKYIDDNDDYAAGLRRVELQQAALLGMVEQARRVVDPARSVDLETVADTPEHERLRQLMLDVRDATQRRHDVLGLVFRSEVAALSARVREAELAEIRSHFGVSADLVPLSSAEQRAGQEPALRTVAPQLGTVMDRVARIPELRRSGPHGWMTGIYRLGGYLNGYELPSDIEDTKVEVSSNALVGDLGPGEDDVRGFRRLRKRHPTRRVIAINAAAISILGGTTELQIRKSNLREVSLADLRP